MDGPKASVRLWITASKNSCDGTGWLAQPDVPAVVPGGGIESERAYIMYIGSASDIMRQYEGMKSLSFVKDHLQRGFLQDFRRVNVALTRARESLWIVGNCNFLAKDALWKAMLDSAADRKLIVAPHEFDRLAPPLPRSNRHNGRKSNGSRRFDSKKRGPHGAKGSQDGSQNSSKRRRHDKPS